MRFLPPALLAAVAVSLPAPASAAYFYSTLSQITVEREAGPDGGVSETTASNTGGPANSGVALGGSSAATAVQPGRIEVQATGTYDSLMPPAGPPPGDGYAAARALGFVEDTLTVSAAAASGFLKVAIVYADTDFGTTTQDPSRVGTMQAVSNTYLRFKAGEAGAEATFIDYNRVRVAFGFSNGFGFTINTVSSDVTTGDFVSGQLFLVPFTSGEALSVLLTADCTGTGVIEGFGKATAGCGAGQRFGWGGILGATDADGNSIALPTVRSASGADYTGNLAGLAFEPFEPVAGVPEPAVWGQLILGFGLVGGLARRRRALHV